MIYLDRLPASRKDDRTPRPCLRRPGCRSDPWEAEEKRHQEPAHVGAEGSRLRLLGKTVRAVLQNLVEAARGELSVPLVKQPCGKRSFACPSRPNAIQGREHG